MAIFWALPQMGLADGFTYSRGVAPNKLRPGATFSAGALEIFEKAIVCFSAQ